MTAEMIEKGIELLKEIDSTDKAIKDINTWIERINMKKRSSLTYSGDGCYNLMLSEYTDGSGNKAVLSRYRGNMEIIEGVKKILEGQLKALNEELGSL